MSSDAVLKPLLTLVIIIIGLAFIVGGKLGPSKLFRFMFAPGISCVGKIIQAVVVLVILGLVIGYGVSRVLAPG